MKYIMLLNVNTLLGFFFSVAYLGYCCLLGSCLFSSQYRRFFKLGGAFLLSFSIFFLLPIPEVWAVYLQVENETPIVVEPFIFLVKTLKFYTKSFTIWGLPCSIARLAWVGGLLYLGYQSYLLSSRSFRFVFALFLFLIYFLLFTFLEPSFDNQRLLVVLQYGMYWAYIRSSAREEQEKIWAENQSDFKGFQVQDAKQSYKEALQINPKSKIYCWILWFGFLFLGAISKYFFVLHAGLPLLILFLGIFTSYGGLPSFFFAHYVIAFFFGCFLAIHCLTYDSVWYSNYKSKMGKKVLVLLGCNSPKHLRETLLSPRIIIRFDRKVLIGISSGVFLFGSFIMLVN